MLGVVATVGEQRVRSPAAAVPPPGQRVDESEQVAALVLVRAAQRQAERDTAAVAGEVQLAGRPASVCRAFPDPGAPFSPAQSSRRRSPAPTRSPPPRADGPA